MGGTRVTIEKSSIHHFESILLIHGGFIFKNGVLNWVY